MIFACAARRGDVFEGDGAAQVVGSVSVNADLRRARARQARVDIPLVVNVSERAGRTAPDDIDDLFNGRAVGVDPRFGAAPPHFGEFGGADAGVGAESAVVGDGEMFAAVLVYFIGLAVGVFCVGEAGVFVRAVAEGFIFGDPAATEKVLTARINGVAARVDEFDIFNLERAVLEGGDCGDSGGFRLLAHSINRVADTDAFGQWGHILRRGLA